MILLRGANLPTVCSNPAITPLILDTNSSLVGDKLTKALTGFAGLTTGSILLKKVKSIFANVNKKFHIFEYFHRVVPKLKRQCGKREAAGL